MLLTSQRQPRKEHVGGEFARRWTTRAGGTANTRLHVIRRSFSSRPQNASDGERTGRRRGRQRVVAARRAGRPFRPGDIVERVDSPSHCIQRPWSDLMPFLVIGGGTFSTGNWWTSQPQSAVSQSRRGLSSRVSPRATAAGARMVQCSSRYGRKARSLWPWDASEG